MSASIRNASHEGSGFDRSVESYLDGRLDRAARAEFEAELKRNPDLRRRLAAGLSRHVDGQREETPEAAERRLLRRRRWEGFLAAASILVSVGIVWGIAHCNASSAASNPSDPESAPAALVQFSLPLDDQQFGEIWRELNLRGHETSAVREILGAFIERHPEFVQVARDNETISALLRLRAPDGRTSDELVLLLTLLFEERLVGGEEKPAFSPGPVLDAIRQISGEACRPLLVELFDARRGDSFNARIAGCIRRLCDEPEDWMSERMDEFMAAGFSQTVNRLIKVFQTVGHPRLEEICLTILRSSPGKFTYETFATAAGSYVKGLGPSRLAEHLPRFTALRAQAACSAALFWRLRAQAREAAETGAPAEDRERLDGEVEAWARRLFDCRYTEDVEVRLTVLNVLKRRGRADEDAEVWADFLADRDPLLRRRAQRAYSELKQ